MVGYDCDGAAGGNLAGEYDAAAEFAGDRSAYIVTEIDFGEARVAGDGNAEEAHVFELEADDADVRPAIVDVGFGAGWCDLLNDLSGNGEVEQDEVAPF